MRVNLGRTSTFPEEVGKVEEVEDSVRLRTSINQLTASAYCLSLLADAEIKRAVLEDAALHVEGTRIGLVAVLRQDQIGELG